MSDSNSVAVAFNESMHRVHSTFNMDSCKSDWLMALRFTIRNEKTVY